MKRLSLYLCVIALPALGDSQLSRQTKRRLCRERTGSANRAQCLKGCSLSRQRWNRETHYLAIAEGEEHESSCKMTCERECLD